MVSKKIFIIAGEASGDLHGANLIHHLKERTKTPLDIYGVGGDKIKQAGAKEFYDLAHFHVTGFSAAVQKIPQYKKAEKIILASIQKVRPDLVILIDNPGFNLHLAKSIRAMGIKMVYFIAPQVWAWGPKRVFKIKKYMDKVLVVFNFEVPFFKSHGVPVAWVGHPLKDMVVSDAEKKTVPQVALMPGSRKGELKTLLPILLDAARVISEKIPDVQFVVLKAPTLRKEAYDKYLKKSKLKIKLLDKNHYHAIRESKLAICCSGTATLECAILGTPMIITNKVSLVSYVAIRTIIKVNSIGLPNLILGKSVFPEFLQYKATPENIGGEAVKILSDEKKLKALEKSCEETSRLIGGTGASIRATDEILSLLN